jgi:hypothetical protein
MPIVLSGATSGSTTVQATDAVTATLTLPSATGTLLSTASPASGNVIQVVNATYSTQATTTNASTMQDTGLTATITPKFATSKILVLVSNACGSTNSAGVNTVSYFQTIRGATIVAYTRFQIGNALASGTNAIKVDTVTQTAIDSPATTSATTYKMQMISNDTTVTTTSCINNITAQMTLMEIAA